MSAAAASPETIMLGDRSFRRMGYGAMRLPGPGVWGEPANANTAKAVLRRAVELGVEVIDTAWYYGPWVSNRLIMEALHPYAKNLLIVTKLGGKRLPDKSWAAAISPSELRQGCEDDLRTLKLERIDLVHLRYIPSQTPLADSLGAMMELQRQGKIKHIGLSNVTRAQLEEALRTTTITSVQNLFSVAHQGDRRQAGPGIHPSSEKPDAVLELCAEKKIPFMPYFPLAMGGLHSEHPAALAAAAKRHGVTPAQIGIAWLMARSPVMLPIPGTSSLAHVEENWKAQFIKLSPDEVKEIAG